MKQRQLRPADYNPTIEELRVAYYSSLYFYKTTAIEDPNRTFSPIAAIGSRENPFVSSSPPEAQKIKKKIIITREDVDYFNHSGLSRLENLKNQGFEIYFALNDKLVSLDLTRYDNPDSNYNVKLGDKNFNFKEYQKLNNDSDALISTLSTKTHEEILKQFQLVADDYHFLSQKELIVFTLLSSFGYYAPNYLRPRLNIKSVNSDENGNYNTISEFLGDLEYFYERYPEKKSAIEQCFVDYYDAIGKPSDRGYKELYSQAITDFKEKIKEIAEVEIGENANNDIHAKIISSGQIKKIRSNLQKPQFSRAQGVLYLGDGNIQADITQTDQSAFKLQEIGKKIQGEEKRLRFSVNKLDIKSDERSFFQEKEVAKFTRLSSPPLVPVDQEFAGSSKQNIYQFDNFILLAGEKKRLYSVQSDE